VSEKAVVRLTSDNISSKANDVVSILRNYSRKTPCARDELAEQAGLTVGQVSTVIKYMRRCCEKDLEKYIPYYPISSKHGYFFASKWEDFAPCYATLEMWMTSIARKIKPMRDKMIKAGVDWHKYIPDATKEDYENWLENIPEQNKDTSWFLDE
jgi:hypothetical protein